MNNGMRKFRLSKYHNLETSSILPENEGFEPPPWNINEHPEKTEGWIEFQKMMRIREDLLER